MIADAEQGYIIQQLVAACINPQKQGRVWNYDQASNVIEPHFSQHTLNKYASLMAQGTAILGFAPAMKKITRARREGVSGGAVSSGGKR